MSAFTDFVVNHGSAILAGSGSMVVYGAVVRHIPDWPLTPAKLWAWFKGSAQEIASQRTGGVVIPTQPAQTASDQAKK